MSQTCLTRAEQLVSTRDRALCEITLDADLDIGFLQFPPYPAYEVPLTCGTTNVPLITQLLVTDGGDTLVTDGGDELIAE